ncbi:MAG: ATPase [Oscillospiraceae bacterium]|jgi:regulator of protease activity HflC (stomatin/prohibitin superfamily)|nr:ATPase [Oscillospiraceae bacterium]MDD3261668.1 ATPase [Oscillospiraceae bacterium]
MSEENTVSAEELIDELESLLEKGWHLPFARGKVVLQEAEVHQMLGELRDSIPREVRQACAIVADRSKILGDAKREAERTVQEAEERARVMTSQQTVLRQAQKIATEMVAVAQKQTRDMRRASGKYVDELMGRADESLTANLSELRNARQSIQEIAAHAGKTTHTGRAAHTKR